MFVYRMAMKAKYTILLLFLSFSLSSAAQDSDTLKYEVGASLNRFVPNRDNENRPYFFSGSFHYKFKSTEKFQHLLNVRVAGNYNKDITVKPLVSKRYLSFEAGYQGRWRRDSTKWRFSWGVNAGIFQVDEKVKHLTIPFLDQSFEPYNRTRYKLALSPQIATEYYFNSKTYLQLAFSVSFGTRYFGETDHLENNPWRGFSAQAPSLGIFRKF